MRMLNALLVGLALVPGLAACNLVETEPAPAAGQTPASAVEQTPAPPQADLALDLSLDERFHPVRREGRSTVLRIEGVPDVELWMVVGRDPVQGPPPTAESILAKARAFLEPIHGELEVAETAEGDSLVRFEARREDGNRTLHTVNWMLLRPAPDAILRADLTLRVPARWADTSLVQGVATHVGDRLHAARFQSGS